MPNPCRTPNMCPSASYDPNGDQTFYEADALCDVLYDEHGIDIDCPGHTDTCGSEECVSLVYAALDALGIDKGPWEVAE